MRPTARLFSVSATVGVVSLLLSLLLAVDDQSQFFRSYLFAYLFWLGVGFGCLAVLMLCHLVGGAWCAALRPVLEAGALTLPLLAVLFVPLAFGLRDLYVWARPEAVASDPLLQAKSPYLNISFFLVRAAIYLVAWGALAYFLSRRSSGQPDHHRLPGLGAIGLIILSLTGTFAMIDWVMSLEPRWYSTVFAVMVASGGVLSAFAFAICARLVLWKRETWPDPSVLNDLGNLLLAFLMIWAYLAFSQFLVVWSGNLSQEITWYVHRLQGGWEWIALAIVVFHFAVPFVPLLSRSLKRNAQALRLIAALVLLTGILDVYWLVMPAFFFETGLRIHWQDGVLLIGISGLWSAAFIWMARRRMLPSVSDTRFAARLPEGAHHG
jgi:hypothetical protein